LLWKEQQKKRGLLTGVLEQTWRCRRQQRMPVWATTRRMRSSREWSSGGSQVTTCSRKRAAMDLPLHKQMELLVATSRAAEVEGTRQGAASIRADGCRWARAPACGCRTELAQLTAAAPRREHKQLRQHSRQPPHRACAAAAHGRRAASTSSSGSRTPCREHEQ
jgi:hypothetical protein